MTIIWANKQEKQKNVKVRNFYKIIRVNGLESSYDLYTLQSY